MALIAYLKSDAIAKPTTIASAPSKRTLRDGVKDGGKAAQKTGLVTSNIEHGELFLHPRGKREQRIRLRWEPGGNKERELATGTYLVTGYRHVAAGEDGTTWIWSTTSPSYRELRVKAGETVHLDVRRRIGVRARAFQKDGRHRVALVFHAERKLGNTIYHNGKRIDIGWECLDAEGAVLAKGKMAYG